MNYEEELKAIADAQKRQKLAELDVTKQQDLQSVQAQQDQLIPSFQTQRNQASTQSQLGAKNFAEYLAKRGQSRAGLSAQAEMSRLNTLGNTLTGINTQEGEAIQGFNTQRNTIQNNYTNNLNSAYNTIDTNLATNLYNEKQRQDDLARQETIRQEEKAIAQQQYQDKLAQQQFENQMAIKSYNLSASKAQDNSLPEGMTFAQNGTAYQVLNGKVVPINYAVKSTTKDPITGKTTTQYDAQKQYEYNKQGYWLQPQAQKINFGTKKTTAYTPWFNQYDNKNYIIAYDIPLPITGDEKNGKEVITNAYKSGVINKTQLKTLADKFGY